MKYGACLGCFGSGRFGPQPTSTNLSSCNGPFNGKCFRCRGTGREPADELRYVAEMNARVAARIAGRAA